MTQTNLVLECFESHLSISIPPATLWSATKVHSESGVRGFESQTPIASVCVFVYFVSLVSVRPHQHSCGLLSLFTLLKIPTLLHNSTSSPLLFPRCTAQPSPLLLLLHVYILLLLVLISSEIFLPHHFIQAFPRSCSISPLWNSYQNL